jgi:hypothetical protein
MKKPLLILGMILLPALAMAAAPDFSGTWARDTANSDAIPDLAYWMTRAVPAPARPAGAAQRPGPAVLLTIRQDAKTLNVIDPSNSIHEYTLTSDGSPHAKAMDTGIQKAEVTAQLQADNLVIETSEPYGGMPGNVTLAVKEVWSLSQDGKTLTITTTRDTPARHQAYKEIYIRTEAQRGTICSDGCVPRQ